MDTVSFLAGGFDVLGEIRSVGLENLEGDGTAPVFTVALKHPDTKPFGRTGGNGKLADPSRSREQLAVAGSEPTNARARTDQQT